MKLFIASFQQKDIVFRVNYNSFKRLSKSLLWSCFVAAVVFTVGINSFAQSRASDGPTPSGLATGAPAGSYSLTDFENVNLFNGNLNFNLPLLKVGGRGSAQSAVQLTIDSTHWSVKRQMGTRNPETYDPFNVGNHPPIIGGGEGTPPSWGVEGELNTDDLEVGYGPGVLNCNIIARFNQSLMKITFTAPDGTQYELRDTQNNGQPYAPNTPSRNRGTIFVASDGSGVTFISNTALNDSMLPNYGGYRIGLTGRLMFRDGTRYDIVNGAVTRICDRNGNEIRYEYYDYYFLLVKTITDSLGRTINFTYPYTGSGGSYDQITFKGVGGASRTIKIWRGTLQTVLRQTQTGDAASPRNYNQLFPDIYNSGYTDGDDGTSTFNNPDNIVTKVELPDGRAYQLYYNGYGELARVELPTGGAVEYDYTPGSGIFSGSSGWQVSRRVVQRRQYDDGTALTNYQIYTPTITPVYNGGSTPSEWTTDVMVDQKDATNNLLKKSKHTFWGSPIASLFKSPLKYSGYLEGRETQSIAYTLDGTTPLRQTNNTWQQCAVDCQLSVAWWQQPSGTPAGYAPANSPRLIQTTQTLSDTGQVSKTEFGYDRYNNQTDNYEYDFGSGQVVTLLRRTHTDYVTDTNYTSYTGAHLFSLPLQSWVASDANGSNKASLTTCEYDNYAADDSHSPLTLRNSVIGFDATNFGTGNTKRGNATAVTSYADAQTPSQPITVYSQYDVLGNVVKSIDGKGYVSTINYADNFGTANADARTNTIPNALSGQSTFAFATSATNPIGYTTYTQFDYWSGLTVDSEDINGNVSSVFYNDNLDRPTQVIIANNLPTLRSQKTFAYNDDLAYRKIVVTSDLFTFGDNLAKIESIYDGLGRTLETKNYKNGGSVKSEQIYDALGRISQTSNPHRGSETVYWTTSEFDALGRMVKVKTPDNAEINTIYAGNAVTVTDQSGKQRRSITNGLGQLIRVDEPNALGQLDVNGTAAQSTSYVYDTLGNLKTVNQDMQTRSFVYDSLSRLKSATNPENGLINYSYDANGNLLIKIDARDVKTIYGYDNLNRVISRAYTLSNGGALPTNLATPNVAYTYDDTAVANSKGKLTRVSSNISETRYTAFDQLSRVTASEQRTPFSADETIANTMPRTSSYIYNLSGALIEQTYPSTRVVKNNLDMDGEFSVVQSKKNQSAGYWNYASHFTFTSAGAVSGQRLGNGRWELTQFNSRLQPTQIGLGTTSENRTNLLKIDYEYGKMVSGVLQANSNNGNLAKQTITVPTAGTAQGFTATQFYEYDELNRIRQASENFTPNGQSTAVTSWTQTFQYDKYGNRTLNEPYTTASVTFPKDCTNGLGQAIICENVRAIYNPPANTANNRLNGYSFDNAGNTTTDAQGKTFTYDAENKQTQVKNSQQQPLGTYYYDGNGKRVKKIVGNEVTIFVYDALGKLVAEYATTIATPTEAKVSYLTADHLGSPRINTDADGRVAARHDYQPFGEEVTRGNYGTDLVKQKFTAYERDIETDLDYAQARYYNNRHGRFTSVDPLNASADNKNPQTFNRYNYALNSPYKFIDPLGLESCLAVNGCGKLNTGAGIKEVAMEEKGGTGTQHPSPPPDFERSQRPNPVAAPLADVIYDARQEQVSINESPLDDGTFKYIRETVIIYIAELRDRATGKSWNPNNNPYTYTIDRDGDIVGGSVPESGIIEIDRVSVDRVEGFGIVGQPVKDLPPLEKYPVIFIKGILTFNIRGAISTSEFKGSGGVTQSPTIRETKRNVPGKPTWTPK